MLRESTQAIWYRWSASPTPRSREFSISPESDPSHVFADDGSLLSWSLPGIPHTSVRTGTLIALVPLTAAAGLAFTRQPLFMLLGPAFLAPILSRYFLHPSYRLTSETARASWGTGQTEIKWSDVRRVRVTDRTVHLSPIERDDFRQASRGVELKLPADAEERLRIERQIRASLPKSVAYDPTSTDEHVAVSD